MPGVDDKQFGLADQKHGSINDYGEEANQLWRTYVTEAESHDRALVEAWKDDMDSIIIFVCGPYYVLPEGVAKPILITTLSGGPVLC